jgi:hypothetical protein
MLTLRKRAKNSALGQLKTIVEWLGVKDNSMHFFVFDGKYGIRYEEQL